MKIISELTVMDDSPFVVGQVIVSYPGRDYMRIISLNPVKAEKLRWYEALFVKIGVIIRPIIRFISRPFFDVWDWMVEKIEGAK